MEYVQIVLFASQDITFWMKMQAHIQVAHKQNIAWLQLQMEMEISSAVSAKMDIGLTLVAPYILVKKEQ